MNYMQLLKKKTELGNIENEMEKLFNLEELFAPG